jgi:hypothetical protein
MLKATKRAQRAIQKKQRSRRSGRLHGPKARSSNQIELMHLDDFHAFALQCQSAAPMAEIGLRFGLDDATVEVTRRVLANHVGRSTTEAGSELPPLKMGCASERRACRRLFKSVSRSILVLSPRKSADIGCILSQVIGFRSPGVWSESGMLAVRRLIADARAGVAKLKVEANAGAQKGASMQNAGFRLLWEPLPCGTDLNNNWLAVVVLALLRSRAAFLSAASIAANYCVHPMAFGEHDSVGKSLSQT